MTTYSVASHNIGDTGSLADLEELARRADVICCQEASDRAAMFRSFLRTRPGWSLYKGGLPGAAADPLLVNTDKLGPVEVFNHPGVGRRLLGRKGAGPLFSKPKPITQFVLQDGTSVFNWHMIASVTRSEAFLGTREYNARRKHYRDHIAALLAVTSTLTDPVILCGDFNAEPDFELLAPLHNVGFIGWTTDPTFGGRAIDHVLHLPGRGLTVTGLVEVLPTDSDHHAVIVPYSREPIVPDPYARSTFHGHPLDNATIDALKAAEGILGYELTIVQGIGGASASAGTHTEGRVVDLVDWDTENKLRVLKDLGFAIWRRPTIPGLWNSHIHGCLILETRGNPRGIAAAALRQIESFDRGRDGLKGDGPDNTYRPDPKVTFQYPYQPPEPPPVVTRVSKARDQITEAIHAVSLASALIDSADEKRPPVRKFIEQLDQQEADLRAILRDMPKT